jgi:glucose-6-phosphate isomerase
VGDILKRARHMSQACAGSVPETENPGLALGAALAELTLAKRDKITFLCSPSLTAFPAWIEQLIAESTGKDRKGIVPVVGERLGPPEKYGADRAFVYLRHEGDENHELDRQVAGLEANGHPVLRIEIVEKTDLGQEFFRWELAVAAAGAALGIHPFNQPDVQLAKDLAKKMMSETRSGKKKTAKLKEEVSLNDGNGQAARLYIRSSLSQSNTGTRRCATEPLRIVARSLGNGYDIGLWPTLSSLHGTTP